MEKIKIAVLLSGLTRYWEITSKCFEYWNNFHDSNTSNVFRN